MPRIYAFDFDGVIADSSRGWAFFCARAWRALGKGKPPAGTEIKRHRPYIKDAVESYGLLSLLTKKFAVTRESVKREVLNNRSEAEKFADTFFSEKDSFIKKYPKKFCELYSLYRFVVPFLKDLVKNEKVYIITNNRGAQISLVLRKYGISLNRSRILDITVGLDKNTHIRKIAKKEDVSPKDIAFVEDSIEHLKKTANSGVQPFLASWGYVLEEDLEKAKRLGIQILDRESVKALTTTDNLQEFFHRVDNNNKVTGKVTRKEAHEKGIWHRAVHVLVLNSKNEFLLQKRSMTKDLYKGYWIDSAAGHVAYGDSYEETAKRELKEELGISARLEMLFDFRKYTGNDNEFIRVFFCRHEGPFRPNKDEVDYVKFFSFGEIMDMMKTENFTPATVMIFNELGRKLELLRRLRLQ